MGIACSQVPLWILHLALRILTKQEKVTGNQSSSISTKDDKKSIIHHINTVGLQGNLLPQVILENSLRRYPHWVDKVTKQSRISKAHWVDEVTKQSRMLEAQPLEYTQVHLVQKAPYLCFCKPNIFYPLWVSYLGLFVARDKVWLWNSNVKSNRKPKRSKYMSLNRMKKSLWLL